jgi:cation transport regulator ChaC
MQGITAFVGSHCHMLESKYLHGTPNVPGQIDALGSGEECEGGRWYIRIVNDQK